MNNHLPPSLFVAWRSPKSGATLPVGKLSWNHNKYSFTYLELAETAKNEGFVPFPEFPSFNKSYHGTDLFPSFRNRLMPHSRPDFQGWVGRLGLEPGAEPMSLLARSGGQRATDHVELFAPPLEDQEARTYSYSFFLRGIRHIPGAESLIDTIEAGNRLSYKQEPGNKHDKMAVSVHKGAAPQKIGYLPLYMSEDFRALTDAGASIIIEAVRVNPAPAPTRERVLCRLVAQTDSDSEPFKPYSTHRFALHSGLAEHAQNPAGIRN